MSVKWAKYRVDRLILAISRCLCAGQHAFPDTGSRCVLPATRNKAPSQVAPFRNGTILLQEHQKADLKSSP